MINIFMATSFDRRSFTAIVQDYGVGSICVLFARGHGAGDRLPGITFSNLLTHTRGSGGSLQGSDGNPSSPCFGGLPKLQRGDK